MNKRLEDLEMYTSTSKSHVKRVQLQFISFPVVIPPEVKHELEQVHQNYMQTELGL